MSNHQRLLKIDEVRQRTTESASLIYLKIQRGEFPKPVRLGPRRVAWVESEIDDYIQRQIDNREEA